MKNDIDLNTLLISIITATSIMIAVIIPFIINSLIEYNNKKEKLLLEMKANYNIFNSFRELISYVFQINFWKNQTVINAYKKAINKNEVEELIKENDFLTLYEAFKYINDEYTSDIISHNFKRIFTDLEMQKYQECANKIWYAFYGRTDIKTEIDTTSFNNIEKINFEKIKKLILKISDEYQIDKLTIEIIADISGNIELTVIDTLSDLTAQYEQPLKSIIKFIFIVLSVSLISCVIIPLIVMLFAPTCSYILTIVSVFIMIVCFASIAFIAGKYLFTKK